MSPKPLYDAPRVGGDILSYCTRCKMELAHVVISMIDGRAAKVICKTCKGQHNYKKGGAGPSPSTRSPRKPSEKTYIKVSEMWEKKMAEAKAAHVRAYSVRDSFTVGEVIQHPHFGMGLVEEVKGNGKIMVLFRDDEKVLVHGLTKL